MPNALATAFAAESATLLLPGGATLLAAGEPAKALYRLSAGRLGELAPTSEGGGRLLTVHRPGALIGGAQLLGGGVARTTVMALRDSEIEAIEAKRAAALLREDPALLAEVARATLEPYGAGPSNERRKSTLLALVATGEGVAVRDFAERLARGMRALGAEVAVIGAEAVGSNPSHLHALEVEHDVVLMAAEHGETDFIAWSQRQMDRLVLVSSNESPPRESPAPNIPPAIRAQRLIDVVLVHPAGAHPHGAAAWLDAFAPARLFHIQAGDTADEARLARVYTGNSIGLALSGGGARAYAHVGVVRALRELGVPVDFIAGTSMGAVIAAGVAMGWSNTELDARVRDAFVKSSPLSDIAFPILAMTRGRIVDRRLADHFGDTDIADLWRPFHCVSTDLTSGGMHVHRRGLLRTALRASLSLPGVLPPVVEDGHVLVDGALVRNLPVDLVREQHDGVTIGVDVASSEGLKPDDLLLKPSGWRWLTSGAWLKGPPIVSVLIRAATLPSFAAAARSQDDLIAIVPDVQGVGLQDWKAYDFAVASGYRAAMAAAETLTALRR
jgi:NTE family protein